MLFFNKFFIMYNEKMINKKYNICSDLFKYLKIFVFDSYCFGLFFLGRDVL